MQDSELNKHNNETSNDIDLLDLIKVFIEYKKIIAYLTIFFSIFGVIYSLLLPNIYESKALLAPASPSSGITNALRNYSGIAGIAGVTVQSEGGSNNTQKAIEKISTLSFFKDEIMPFIFLPNLMAFDYWDPETNNLFYDDSIFIKDSNIWISKTSKEENNIPTAQRSFEVFKQHLSLSEDINTGFITLSIKHESPYVAKKWAELVIEQINSFYRQKDKEESEKAVLYLNQKIKTTNLSEVKESISELLQEEIQKLTLIEASDAYVFEYIDNPEAMERKSEPSRAIICILFSIIGLIIGINFALIKHYFFKRS